MLPGMALFSVHGIPSKSIFAIEEQTMIILFVALQIRGTDNGVRPLAVKSL